MLAHLAYPANFGANFTIVALALCLSLLIAMRDVEPARLRRRGRRTSQDTCSG